MRRAIEIYYEGLACLQPEASRPTQARISIISIILCEKATDKHNITLLQISSIIHEIRLAGKEK